MANIDPTDASWITDAAVRNYVGQQHLEEILALVNLDGYRAAANAWLIDTIDAHLTALGVYPLTISDATALQREPFLEACALDLFYRAKGGSDSTGDLAEYLASFADRRDRAWERGLRVASRTPAAYTALWTWRNGGTPSVIVTSVDIGPLAVGVVELFTVALRNDHATDAIDVELNVAPTNDPRFVVVSPTQDKVWWDLTNGRSKTIAAQTAEDVVGQLLLAEAGAGEVIVTATVAGFTKNIRLFWTETT